MPRQWQLRLKKLKLLKLKRNFAMGKNVRILHIVPKHNAYQIR